MSKDLPSAASPWPHRVALALCCATFPLLWVGGLVTTTKAGMAVPDWPSTYGYNLFLYPLETWFYGPWDLFIEHGHRLLATVIGFISIVLVVVAWTTDSKPWLRWMSLAALGLVILQGVIGGMRVVLNRETLAMAHGCVGPFFFAVTVAIAVWSSPSWMEAEEGSSDETSTPQAAKLARVAQLTTIMAYIQLLLGAGLRHLSVEASPGLFQGLVWLHVAMALGLFVHVVLVVVAVLRDFRAVSQVFWPAMLLGLLIVAQLALGSATWVLKYSWPAWVGAIFTPPEFVIEAGGWLQTNVVTAHMAVGSLILATALRVALWSHSPVVRGAGVSPVESSAMESDRGETFSGSMPRLEVVT